MSQQEPATAGAESRHQVDTAVRSKRTPREQHFTQEVIDAAHHYGWQPFHLRDREGAAIVRGKGFPDLVMYRGNQLIVAELKRNEESQLSPDQVAWMNALSHHVPAYEWRPKDWEEIERILEHGGEIQDDSKPLPTVESSLSSSQIPRNFHTVIKGLVETIEDKEFDRGDRSRLRRMDPDNPDTATFWRLIARAGMPQNPNVSKWGLIIHGMALMSHGAGLAHDPQMDVGQTLYQGGGKRVPFYTERRLSTLLAARGPALRRLLARLFRMLAAEGCPFNWYEMAEFVLYEGNDEVRADQSRVKIARAYYYTERRSSQTVDNNQS